MHKTCTGQKVVLILVRADKSHPAIPTPAPISDADKTTKTNYCVHILNKLIHTILPSMFAP